MNKLIITAVVTTLLISGCKSTGEKVQEQLSTNVIDISDSMLQMSRAVVLQNEPVKVSAEQMIKANSRHGGEALIAAGALTYAGSNSRGSYNAAGAMALIGVGKMIYDATKSEELFDAIKYTVETQKGELMEVFQIDGHPNEIEGESFVMSAPFAQGSAVFVKRYSSGKVRISLDTTQGVMLNRTRVTQYADCDQVCEDKKFAREQAKRRIVAGTNQAERIASDGTKTTVVIEKK
jgi:outer membrane murein-binding lipoprotein Lpp